MEVPFTLRSDPLQRAGGFPGRLLVAPAADRHSPRRGVEARDFSDTGVTITRKRHTKQLAWDELERADFASINTTPWLTLAVRGGERHRLCLEDFTAQAQRATATESWTIANRIPVSINSRGVELE